MAGRAERPTVLVVSKDEDLQASTTSVLEEEGYQVTAVGSGHDALDRARAQSFDVVLVDSPLADTDGLSFLRRLQEEKVDSEVLFFCDTGALDQAAQAFEQGAYDLLLKPLPAVAMLRHGVRRAVERRQLVADRGRLMQFLQDKAAELDAKSLELDGSVERLQAIQSLGRELSLIERAERVQMMVVETIATQLGAGEVAVLLMDEERGDLRVAASRGIDADRVRATAIRLPSGTAPSGARTTMKFQSNGGEPGGDLLGLGHIPEGRFTSSPVRLEAPLIRGGRFYGVVRASSGTQPYSARDLEFINILASQAAAAIDNLDTMLDMKQSYIEVIYSLVSAIEMKDSYTSGHSRRVTRYTKAIARHMGLSRAETEIIANGALLHDVGKIGMRHEVINHPGALSEIEFQEFKKHPTLGRTILMPGRVFRDLIPMVYLHHERMDGRGYPTGAAGDQIPLGARIVTAADAFDAMTSNRAYRRALPQDVATEEMQKNAGTQFDPDVIEVFVDAVHTGRIEAFDRHSGVGTTPDRDTGELTPLPGERPTGRRRRKG